jgi:hypothetical protein
VRIPTRQTVWNWATKGVRKDPASESSGRLKLATADCRGVLVTSPTNVKNFLAAYAKIVGRGNRI